MFEQVLNKNAWQHIQLFAAKMRGLFAVLVLVYGVVAQVPDRPPTYQMNRSTIIMPCNETGFTDPASTRGWGVVDFDWSNAKEIWAKSKPMNDEELLFKQVQMTTSATAHATVWVYRCSVYAYPWYTSVRTILDDPAYSDWFIKVRPFKAGLEAILHVSCTDWVVV